MTLCGPACDMVLSNRQTGKLNFDTNYITIGSCYDSGLALHCRLCTVTI